MARRDLGRLALIALAVIGAVAGLATLALPGWASWNDLLGTNLTPTPTRTPRPITPEAPGTPVDLSVVLLVTATPAPAATPASIGAEDRSAGITPYLLGVVERYGIDARRRFVVVDPNLQRMTVWEPGKPIREMPISTGDEAQGWRTAAWYGLIGRYVGTFNAFGVYADDAWYLFRDAGDILIHSAPYRLIDGAKQYEALDALGSYPASRGCIRLRPEDARWFTSWDPQGVPLVILPRTQDLKS